MKGVEEFMGFVRQNFRENQDILCPCKDCLNVEHRSQAEVEEHILCNGMSVTYTRWVFHGEAVSDDEGDNTEGAAYQSDDDDERDVANGGDVAYMVDDMFMSGRQGEGKPNLFSKLMDEAKKDLYEGCSDFTRLSFIIKLLHIKSYNRITNRAFNQFVELISVAFHMLIYLNHTLKLRMFLVKSGWVTRQFMFASLIVHCFGANMPTRAIVLNARLQDGKLRREGKRYLTRYLGTFLSSQGFKDFLCQRNNQQTQGGMRRRGLLRQML